MTQMPQQIKVTCPRCGGHWFGRRAEHCPVCHQTFTSTSAGDAHRAGRHGIDRHCLPITRVRRRDGEGRPPYGLKWNPSTQAWEWDRAKPALSRLTAGTNRGSEPFPGTKYQGEVPGPRSPVRGGV